MKKEFQIKMRIDTLIENFKLAQRELKGVTTAEAAEPIERDIEEYRIKMGILKWVLEK